jgi:hypothetical protein
MIINLMHNPHTLPTPSSPFSARWKLSSQLSTKHTGFQEYALESQELNLKPHSHPTGKPNSE